METTLKNEPADWKQGEQIRLMELDVDPGHDADLGVHKSAGI
jgi:hypothetical protein